MRVLVTGGAEFIGSHVAEHLVGRGHEVAVVDNFSTDKRENVPQGITLHEVDIRSGSEIEEVFARFRPQVVSHQAAQMDVRRSVAEPDFDADVNIVGTLRLLESCVEHEVQKVVFASTGGAVYGEQQEFPAPEDHPQYSVAPYGVSKLAGERYLHYYHTQYSLPYVALRYANVYGPRQGPHGEARVVAIFCGNLAAGKTSRINGTGEQSRDYTYVGDVARANVMAVEGESPSGAYNIGTALETSVNRLYELLQGTSGKDLPPEHGPGKPGEQLRSSIDPSLAEQVMGWRPEVGLEAGLKDTLRFFGAL